MKQENKNSYDNENSKTEFLFESDAEKVMIKEAIKPKRKKLYPKILFNTFIICIIMGTFFTGLSYYEQGALTNIKASVAAKTNTIDISTEKLNQDSKLLKTFKNNFDDKYGIIINKANPINEDQINNYKQVIVNDNLFGKVKIEEETYNQYLLLKENLLSRGYYINIKSGFRTFQQSEIIYNEFSLEKGINYAKKYVAKPGTSEHNTGLAFDFTISTKKNSTKTNYESDEYFYLENIAYLYGFIIRYPKDKEAITGYSYEPWHLRYVGKNLAKYLKKNNLALEEYYEIK